MSTRYAIEFDLGLPDGQIVYAGETKEGLGIALHLDTALLLSNRETAERFLANGYGKTWQEQGRVIEVD